MSTLESITEVLMQVLRDEKKEDFEQVDVPNQSAFVLSTKKRAEALSKLRFLFTMMSGLVRRMKESVG